MTYRSHLKSAGFALVCAAAAAACEGGMRSPVSPSAATDVGGQLNSDGSNLKVSAPIAIFPLFESTNVAQAPQLVARASTGNYQVAAAYSYRFQVSDNESFGNIVSTGTGTADGANVVRFTVDTALAFKTRYVWRLRAEMQDAYGPWSSVMAFTTLAQAGTGTAPPTGPTSPTAGPRPADPPPGQRLPLPDMISVLARFSDARDSCPRGLKYVNNPWQDRVLDAFRQIDSRWGYNAKPTRTAVDNNGVPVVAAGDEAAYHYSGGPDQGSTEVHLVDMLIGHCGDAPTLTWRVFTGEEPGRWTGAGRF